METRIEIPRLQEPTRVSVEFFVEHLRWEPNIVCRILRIPNMPITDVVKIGAGNPPLVLALLILINEASIFIAELLSIQYPRLKLFFTRSKEVAPCEKNRSSQGSNHARTRRICLRGSSSLRFVRASDSESESRESFSPQAPGPEPASRSG